MWQDSCICIHFDEQLTIYNNFKIRVENLPKMFVISFTDKELNTPVSVLPVTALVILIGHIVTFIFFMYYVFCVNKTTTTTTTIVFVASDSEWPYINDHSFSMLYPFCSIQIK